MFYFVHIHFQGGQDTDAPTPADVCTVDQISNVQNVTAQVFIFCFYKRVITIISFMFYLLCILTSEM